MTKQSSIPDFGWCRHVGKGGYMSPTQHYWRVNSAAICGAAFRYKTLCLAYLAVSPSRLIETTRGDYCASCAAIVASQQRTQA